MIYRSNLDAPDLQPYFQHVLCRPMPHSNGHSVLSDFADSDDPQLTFYHKCGMWTHSEAAILYHCAKQLPGAFLDIGSHTGWTAAHMLAAGRTVHMVDPMLNVAAFAIRAKENLAAVVNGLGIKAGAMMFGITSRDYFAQFDASKEDYYDIPEGGYFTGVCIDGDHMDPHPLLDAQDAVKLLAPTGVILLHDAIGEPVQAAVRWLIGQGFKHRVYLTPHVVVACWRGEFTPPEYAHDPKVAAAVRGHVRI